MPRAILPQSKLKELFDYNPSTGVLSWRSRPVEHFKTQRTCSMWNTKNAGKAAGCLMPNGYLQVSINDVKFFAHRIIYKWLHDSEPEQIDHIDGIGENNRPGNLRAATHQINSKNQKLRSTNTSGIMGVCWYKATGKWRAQIKVAGKQEHLGFFDDIKDASAARQAAEVEHGFHENHGRRQPELTN